MNISDRGLDLIIQHEGMILNLYNCPANHATIGVGHLVHYGPINGTEPKEFLCGITQQRALELLRDDVKVAEKTVNNLVKAPLNQNQFDALVSFVFNLGETNFAKSTLLAGLNSGNYDAVPSELNRWVYGGGKVLPGLVKRRADEGKLFQTITNATNTTKLPHRLAYTVKAGDTLSAIALRELGSANRWNEITNSDGKVFSLDEARRLKVGAIVYLPEK